MSSEKGPARPTVSSGADAAERFVEKISREPIDLAAEGIFTVSIIWKGKRVTATLGPDNLASYTDRIEGKLRELAAAYLVKRDGNRCTIQSEFCTQGKEPFARPAGADFDHINGNWLDHHLRNLRLTCHSCNSHLQELQRKQIIAAASTRNGERESQATRPSSTETERSTAMRARWLMLIRGTLEGIPDALKWDGKEISGKKLAEKAPRACARSQYGEETLGVAKTYESYITFDSSENGGPLVITYKVSKQSGRLEMWVKRGKS